MAFWDTIKGWLQGSSTVEPSTTLPPPATPDAVEQAADTPASATAPPQSEPEAETPADWTRDDDPGSSD